MSNPKGNPGTRAACPLGHIPRFGEVSDYARRTGLPRIVIIAGLRTGQFWVGSDGLLYPRPVEGGKP
jgi:hypothetical protein